MKIEVSVPEVVHIFKEIRKGPEKLFKMIRVEMKETVGEYLSKLMDAMRPSKSSRIKTSSVAGSSL